MDTFVSTVFALLSVIVILMFLPEILGFGVLVGAIQLSRSFQALICLSVLVFPSRPWFYWDIP